MNAEVFRTFWHGPHLTWIAELCLSSFIARGHGVELFSYGPIDGVPSGVVIRDAAEILPCRQLFLYRGGDAKMSAPSLHSNVFRYKLLHDIGGWWIDADVLRLDGEIPTQFLVFGEEDFIEGLGPGTEDRNRLGFGTAVMKFPARAEIMRRAYAEAATLAAANPAWGATGPRLFTRLVQELGLSHHAVPQSAICALTYKEAYKFVRTENSRRSRETHEGCAIRPPLSAYVEALRNVRQVASRGLIPWNSASVCCLGNPA